MWERERAFPGQSRRQPRNSRDPCRALRNFVTPQAPVGSRGVGSSEARWAGNRRRRPLSSLCRSGGAVAITDRQMRYGPNLRFTAVHSHADVHDTRHAAVPASTVGVPGPVWVWRQQLTTWHAAPILGELIGPSSVCLIDGVLFDVSTWRSRPCHCLSWPDKAAEDRILSCVDHQPSSASPIRLEIRAAT